MAIDFPNSPATNDSYTSGGRTWLYNGTAWTLLTLTQTVIPSNSVTSSSIVNDTIVNADINSAASIALSKLASGTSGQIVLANASGIPTYTTVSGDITITNSGNAQIIANAITSTELADNSVTQIKLADRAVGSSELDNLTLNAQTGTSYTLVLTDAHKLVTLSNSSPITVTIPAEASVNFDIGDQVNLMQLGSGQVTVSGGVSVTIRSQGSKLKLNGQYATAVIIKIAADEWVLVGNTAA